MDILQSSIVGFEMTDSENYHFVQKLLQPLGIVEGTILWAWGGLLVAVAAAVTIPKLVSLHQKHRDANNGRELPACGVTVCDGESEVSSDACSSSVNYRSSEKRVPGADWRKQYVQEFYWSTKHRFSWGENQMDVAGDDDYWKPFFHRDVVQLWPPQTDSGGGGSRRTVQPFLEEPPQMPIISLFPQKELSVWDQRISHQSPVISSRRKPFSGTLDIHLGYRPLDDESVPDLRMLCSNCGVVSSLPGGSSSECGSNYLKKNGFERINNEDEFRNAGYRNVLGQTEFRGCSERA